MKIDYILDLAITSHTRLKERYQKILQFLETSSMIVDSERSSFIQEFQNMNSSSDCTHLLAKLSLYPYRTEGFGSTSIKEFQLKLADLAIYDYWCSLRKFIKENSIFNQFEKYLDSDILKCKGDIIITDPCYILNTGSTPAESLADLEITNCLCKSTIWGDWSCTTVNSETEDIIGEFCADSGQVCVCHLEDVLKYRPNFKKYIEKYPYAVTHIPNFCGTAQIIVERNEYDNFIDYAVRVIGHGVNSVTNEPIHFITQQTGY